MIYAFKSYNTTPISVGMKRTSFFHGEDTEPLFFVFNSNVFFIVVSRTRAYDLFDAIRDTYF